MANYTWSVKSRRVYEWRTHGHPLIDSDEIGKMASAADARYREVHGLDETVALPADSLWWFGDDEGGVGIRFETLDEADEAAMRVAKLCNEAEATATVDGTPLLPWVPLVRAALKGETT